MLRCVRPFVAVILLAGFASSVPGQTPPQRPSTRPAEAEMIAAMQAFYHSLDPEQRKLVRWTMDDPERTNWAFTPVPRKGLPWKSMTPQQRALGEALVRTGLSQEGYAKAEAVQKLENVLARIENNPTRRDPNNYYISLFGVLGGDGPLGWRFEGHHLAFNFTIAPGNPAISAPAFIGVNPAKVLDGPQAGSRILVAEEDLARQLVKGLSEPQRKTAIINAVAPREILTTNVKKVTPMPQEGIPAAQLDATQKKLLVQIIESYTHRMRSELAADEMKKIEQAGIDKVYFAWAGATEVGAPHYYRIHGPTFLIEYDNTQNNANHIHSVWRDLTNDFGEDLLRQHYATHPHPAS